eukprot:g3814.t1
MSYSKGHPATALHTLLGSASKLTRGQSYSFKKLKRAINTQNSDTTHQIEAASTPVTITIVTQPPLGVGVGELFRVQVRLTIADGSPVPCRGVEAVVTDASIVFETAATFIARTSGEVPTDVLSKWSKITLDPTRLKVFSDNQGMATFTLRVLRGAKADFKLYFTSGSRRSPKTTTIQLANPIAKVQWVRPAAGQVAEVQAHNLTYLLFKNRESFFSNMKIKFPFVQHIQALPNGTAQPMPMVRLLDNDGYPVEAALGNVEVRFLADLTTPELHSAVHQLSNSESFSNNFNRMGPLEKSKWVFTLLMQGARRLNVVPIPQARISACWSACRTVDNEEDCLGFSSLSWRDGAKNHIIMCGLSMFVAEGVDWLSIMLYAVTGIMILQMLAQVIFIVLRKGNGIHGPYSFATRRRQAQHDYTWYGMRSFKKQVLAARIGKTTWDFRRARMADAANYVGLTISNSIIIFFLVTFVVALVVLTFAWHITRGILFHPILWNYFLVPMIAPLILNIAIKKVFVYKIITSQSKPMRDRLRLRRVFHSYDLVMVVFRLFTGPITALFRAIMGFGVTILTLPFMDRSPIPGWLERYMLLDMGSQAFHAMVLMHHRLSNPVMNVAIELWSHATFRRMGANLAVSLRHESALGADDNAGYRYFGGDRYKKKTKHDDCGKEGESKERSGDSTFNKNTAIIPADSARVACVEVEMHTV